MSDSQQPVTDHVHDNSWSANLEKPQYADDRQLIVDHAVDAIEHTVDGTHVNLVTHAEQGHPEAYLYGAIEERVPDVELEYVEQCGCGGHVVRAYVGE
jgi:putative CGCGG family rSAM target protein